jgi:hypothetical protein
VKKKLLIVTDLGLFKAYHLDLTPRNTPRLETVEEIVMNEAHRRFDEVVTDMAGRHAAPGQKHGGAPMIDHHNLELETKRRLIKRIARHIQELVQRNDHGVCWLAAHKEINHQIIEALPQEIRGCIGKNVALDLVKADQKELLEHFLTP